jgi:hypothetical protein
MSNALLFAWVIILMVLVLIPARPAEAQPAVTLAIDDANAAEAGPATGAFTVTRTGDPTEALAVWVTIGGSATWGSDYSLPGLSWRGDNDFSILIQGNQLSATITLTPVRDNLAEGTENFTVTLRGPGDAGNDYTIGDPLAGAIAITDDVAQVTLVIDDANAAEAGQATGAFTVTRTGNGDPAAALSVWVTIGGSATWGSDYSLPGLGWRGSNDFSILIQGNQLSATITLTPVFDENIEGDETFDVELRGPGDAGQDYTVGLPESGQIVIRDFVQIVFKDGFEDAL